MLLKNIDKVSKNELRTYSIELISVANRFSKKGNEARSVLEFDLNK